MFLPYNRKSFHWGNSLALVRLDFAQGVANLPYALEGYGPLTQALDSALFSPKNSLTMLERGGKSVGALLVRGAQGAD